jgi:hypothetical protein
MKERKSKVQKDVHGISPKLKKSGDIRGSFNHTGDKETKAVHSDLILAPAMISVQIRSSTSSHIILVPQILSPLQAAFPWQGSTPKIRLNLV